MKTVPCQASLRTALVPRVARTIPAARHHAAPCLQCSAVSEKQNVQAPQNFAFDCSRPAESADRRHSTRTAALGLLSTDPGGSFDSYDEEESASNKKERFGLRAAVKFTNASVLAVALGTFFAAEPLHLEGVRNAYEAAMLISPVALMAGISGVVYGLGDITAQAFDTRINFSALDWQRTLRSASIGAFAHGPLSYQVFSSNNSLIDQAAQLSTAGSVAWNTLYFALLGFLRRDNIKAVFQDLREYGFDLLKAGWRIWPIVHMVTYSVVPAQDRLLFVDLVELAWISVLLVWTLQKGSDTEEDDSLAFADQPDTGSTTSEMRALLVDSVDDLGDSLDSSKLQGTKKTDS